MVSLICRARASASPILKLMLKLRILSTTALVCVRFRAIRSVSARVSTMLFNVELASVVLLMMRLYNNNQSEH